VTVPQPYRPPVPPPPSVPTPPAPANFVNGFTPPPEPKQQNAQPSIEVGLPMGSRGEFLAQSYPYGYPPYPPPGMPPPGMMPPGGMLPPPGMLPAAPGAASAADPTEHLAVLRDSLYPAQRELAADALAACDWQRQPQIVEALLQAARNDPAASVR